HPAPVSAQDPPRPCRAAAARNAAATGTHRRGVRLLQPERTDHGDPPLPRSDPSRIAQVRLLSVLLIALFSGSSAVTRRFLRHAGAFLLPSHFRTRLSEF